MLLYTLAVSFFFLMIRRPPRSTLFPTRRSSDLRAARHSARPHGHAPGHGGRGAAPGLAARRLRGRPDAGGRRRSVRSEEHTSELQSHVNLVCRLLLEKKK